MSKEKTKKMYNVSSPTKYTSESGTEETFWAPLGKGFETEKGIMLRLNALPINNTIFLSETKKQDTK